jgi:hypothetical protein
MRVKGDIAALEPSRVGHHPHRVDEGIRWQVNELAIATQADPLQTRKSAEVHKLRQPLYMHGREPTSVDARRSVMVR